jgi:hypothetical protein
LGAEREIDHIGYVSPHIDAEGSEHSPFGYGYNARADQEVINAFTVVRDGLASTVKPSEVVPA